MGKLLQLITKLFGKNALSKTLGTRTNVIKLPSNEKKRLIKDELNIEAASDLAAQKVLKEAEDLIADIPRMNDQEVLTFTGNLQRLDNKLNPPSAEVLDITTKQPVTKEGIEQLAASQKSPVMTRIEETLKDLQMNNPYRPGGALDPQMGIVRTAARQVLQKLAREGKIQIADPREAKAIIEGYQGGVDPIEVFRKTFGQDALGDLANLGDELLEIDNRGGSFKELKKILEDEGFFDLQQPKNPEQGMTDAELMKKIMDEDPEEFATGGRVGFDQGGPTDEGILSLEEAKELNPTLFMDTTTYNPIPEDADRQAAAEIAKVIMGTRGLAEEDGISSSTEFIYNNYVIPKRKDMMENYGLTLKEADDLIREEMEKFRTNKAVGGRVGFQKGTSKIFDQLEMNVPHPYGHRVNYQIGGDVAYDATNPIYGSSAITVTPDTIMGPKGNQIQAQMGKPSMISQFFSGLKPMDKSYATRAQDIARPYVDMATKAGYGNVPGQIQGIGSDVRHTVGASMGKDAVIDFISQFGVKPEGRFADFVGNAAIFGSTAAQELQDAYGSLKRGEGLAQPFEDVKANFAAMNLPYGSSEQEKLDYAIAQSPSKYMIDTVPNQQTTNSDLLALERARLIKEGIDPMSVGLIGGTGDPNQQTTNSNIQNLTQLMDDVNQTSGTTTIRSLEEAKNYLRKQGLAAPSNQESVITDGPYKFKIGTDGSITYLGLVEGYATGGRVGYAYGSGLKLVQILTKLGKNLKKEIKKAVDDLIPSGDPKLDADMAVDNMLEDLNIDRETLDQYDILDAYGMAYDELKQPLLKQIKNKPKPFTGKLSDDFDGDTASLIKELESVGLSKNAERLRLKQKYPGITDELVTQIIEDTNPKRKAEVLATLDQSMFLMKEGKSADEAVDILKQEKKDRKLNAEGGLNYLSGF